MPGTKDHATLMTEGAPWRHILTFAAPVLLGQLFQQLYNVVDSLVVGNYLDNNALAAVSSSGNIIHLFIGFFTGLFTGASVLIARYFGAEDKVSLEKSVHTTAAFGLICGVLFSLMGVSCTPALLRWMGTPKNVYPVAIVYFRIYFAGGIFQVLYNTAAGICQAVGDARYPLRMLMISSVTNVALDLLFIAVFHMGVEGAAWATIISQFLAAGLSFVHLIRSDSSYRIRIQKIGIHRESLRKIIQLGVPSGIQNSIIGIANIVVQSSINLFGENAVAGCGIYSKVSDFAFMPITSFSLALSTYVGQNLGAKKPERAKKGAIFGVITCMLCSEVIGLIFYCFAPQLLSIFTQNQDVISFGVRQAKTICFFYFLLSFTHAMAGVLRGAGKAIIPMLTMIVCWCAIRISYLIWIARPTGDIRLVFWCYPLTWLLSSIVLLIYGLKADWAGEKQEKAKSIS